MERIQFGDALSSDDHFSSARSGAMQISFINTWLIAANYCFTLPWLRTRNDSVRPLLQSHIYKLHRNPSCQGDFKPTLIWSTSSWIRNQNAHFKRARSTARLFATRLCNYSLHLAIMKSLSRRSVLVLPKLDLTDTCLLGNTRLLLQLPRQPL